jgi:hypothetical protein
MPIKGEDKTRVLFLFEISDRPMSMSASGPLTEVIGFYAPAIADYPYVPTTPHDLGVELWHTWSRITIMLPRFLVHWTIFLKKKTNLLYGVIFSRLFFCDVVLDLKPFDV